MLAKFSVTERTAGMIFRKYRQLNKSQKVLVVVVYGTT